VLDLFSGIGGFAIGLERAGMQTVAFCETEPFCQNVLKKHWPGVPIYDDVKTLTADRLARDGVAVDVICGGFPCQDISTAGKGAGLAGARSGLWFEFHRLIAELKPRYAIIENVAALRSKGLDQVLSSLAEIGYDAEWHCIPASAVGAPHRRDRIWIVAYSDSEGQRIQRTDYNQSAEMARSEELEFGDIDGCSAALANAYESGLERHDDRPSASFTPKPITTNIGSADFSDGSDWWRIEPDVGRVADGVPARTHRLKALGNAVVPQIPKMIGRAIMEHYR